MSAAARPTADGRQRVNPRLDEFQRRHHWAGLPLAVIYKFLDDQGSYLAALITHYGFLSVFPLLLVAATVLGFVLDGNPHLRDEILNSAGQQIPVVGTQLVANAHGYSGSWTALVVGILTGLYGGTGIGQAAQNAMNAVWAVPRNERPNPVKGRLRSLGLLLTLGVALLLTAGLSGVSSGLGQYIPVLQDHPTWTNALSIILSAVLNVLIFTVAFRVLTARDLSVRDVILGATIAGLAWEGLQKGGTAYINHELKGSNAVYGTFATVLGLIAWIYLVSLVLVFCAELNVVVRRRLWPRALLTPFTDDVNLTHADQRAYGALAKAQRTKGFETVDVDFDRDRADQERGTASADRADQERGRSDSSAR